MLDTELFQLVVVDVMRKFDTGKVLPLECVGQGGKNLQRRQGFAKSGGDAFKNASIAISAEEPVRAVITVRTESAVSKALLQSGSAGANVSGRFVQGGKLLIDQRRLPFGYIPDIFQQCF